MAKYLLSRLSLEQAERYKYTLYALTRAKHDCDADVFFIGQNAKSMAITIKIFITQF